MKAFFVIVIVQAVALSVNAQCLRPCGPNVLAAPMAAPIAATLAAALPGPCVGPAIAPTLSALTALGPNTVANSLADTLSLLTVSSLLAEKLPLGYPGVGPVGCGCGNPLGYPYVL